MNITLPEWAVKKAKTNTMMILVGNELVAFKDPKKEWKIKEIRCVQCGECCLDTPDGHTPFGSDDENKCNALEKVGDKWLCRAGPVKPFRCLPDPSDDYNCSIRYF
jgi:hypothetical protein